jgi:hypothetical protein
MRGSGIKHPSLARKGMNQSMRNQGEAGPASPAIFIHSPIAGNARR